jgi:ubiquinone/menaquinone biosynthesis C-methylase UbiE
MGEYQFRRVDFENPSCLFILEDIVKGLIGGLLFYKPYFKTFDLRGDENVLDFGCGGGVGGRCLSKFLNEQGHLTCVDISNFWIDKAKKRLKNYPNVDCKLGDIRELDIPCSSFDAISVIHVIHDIAPAERQDIVTALSGKLKAGGIFFIRERIGKSHGMPTNELRTLLSNMGLQEINHKETNSEYTGKYQKAA